ncbi:unnamed protein product [Microthlaspi erraticum]|uniref:F-box domain-containing protein n=1 Tax=Microthlaspi erraticum TaxID=1685480 RepID=A0A6D2L304_9BRAS|nr:unnamed protein product [Microthlaspi erraticum]CAA7059184.1 unnamed protein product [Microthlaspi erraticum]
MAPAKLPSELEEEILIRVPPLSLARFRTVCKPWAMLLNDNRFINNHLALARACPQFIFATKSKIYSISINFDDDPKTKVCKINLEIPGLESYIDPNFYHCDGLLLSTWRNGAVVWNPWLRQSKWIESKVKISGLCGIGYDSSRSEKSYKIVGYSHFWRNDHSGVYGRVVIYGFATNTWKYIGPRYKVDFITKQPILYNVSLNGNLYWTDYNLDTGECFIRSLDCSKEIFKSFCILPCKKKDSSHSHALAGFNGDRFSLLEQCDSTRKIEIWVTKNKINIEDDGEAVVWIKFMNVSRPNFPMLYNRRDIGSCSSYLVDDSIYGKSFVACCRDETRQPCIYVVRGDLFKKIKLYYVVDPFCHSVYIPSLIPIPWMSSDQENNKNIEV